ncbi:MAG: hypothetical protein FJY86_03340 [Candidatus Diapherotrites archaeon]|uniref:Uncharacterized protein n=1 Tax=Candidatus Iainarchaeum sp. TaxID=3101447 RepID=A0A8T4C7Q7_9ARCH|nr:hypothetical protein [Candidatus Diapherotrites archaeon]
MSPRPPRRNGHHGSPFNRPRQNVERERRARQYQAHDETWQGIGGFSGREKVDIALLKRQAGLPGAMEYSNGSNTPNAQRFYVAVLRAFNGNESNAARYLDALRKTLLGK